MSATLQTTAQSITQKAWSAVFKLVNNVLRADQRFGFHLIEQNIDPTFDQMAMTLGIMDTILNAMVSTNTLDHDGTRQALNAKQCIWHVQRLIVAVRGNDTKEYEIALQYLRGQTQI